MTDDLPDLPNIMTMTLINDGLESWDCCCRGTHHPCDCRRILLWGRGHCPTYPAHTTGTGHVACREPWEDADTCEAALEPEIMFYRTEQLLGIIFSKKKLTKAGYRKLSEELNIMHMKNIECLWHKYIRKYLCAGLSLSINDEMCL